MKKLTIPIATALVAALAASVYAACPAPLPTCPGGVSIIVVGDKYWPCCRSDMTCPLNGAKLARFFNHQQEVKYQENGVWKHCLTGKINPGPDELDECCGDPVGTPREPE